MREVFSRDGSVGYEGDFLAGEQADDFLQRLHAEIPWQHDRVKIFGRETVMRRMSAWFADDGKPYRYSGISRPGLVWRESLLELKTLVEKASGETFNSCLANSYPDGNDGMGWHADNEKEIGAGSTIASVSFGAERRFDFRHNVDGEKRSIILEHGSLLLMKGALQQHWKHALPKSKKVTEERLNFTFRQLQ